MRFHTLLFLSFLLLVSCALICTAQHPGLEKSGMFHENVGKGQHIEEKRSCIERMQTCGVEAGLPCCSGAPCICPYIGDCICIQ
uniref:U25-theraphotoxin-Cg1b n=1 Tax=Chilobrachys guangxiensis TaxID=278060 RepID=JZT55_CHIGU|nr:RecName: Full=U25-theraphotoxin-Cg1b; Short=U25-TRTX-Cg1b; AltName: Full=Jingzhaotoxin-55; Short=JZTX-55; Flags: Precursor [Chilobrachys guangxiensis]ABY71725.1 cystine knot toxin [Chilobrachys guangxiensis]